MGVGNGSAVAVAMGSSASVGITSVGVAVGKAGCSGVVFAVQPNSKEDKMISERVRVIFFISMSFRNMQNVRSGPLMA
jgi:hypothetical protein